MPIYEFTCQSCGSTSEFLVTGENDVPVCKSCGSEKLTKLLSATSSYSGTGKNHLPGPGDTGCCGHAPGEGDCSGPGSCCGKS